MGRQESIFDLAGEEKLGLFVNWLNKRLLFLLLLLLHYIFTTTFTTTNLLSTSYGLGNRIWGSQLSRYNSKSINCYRKQQILQQLRHTTDDKRLGITVSLFSLS